MGSFRLLHEVARALGKRQQASVQALGKADGDPGQLPRQDMGPNPRPSGGAGKVWFYPDQAGGTFWAQQRWGLLQD